jgi:hypothetical protein
LEGYDIQELEEQIFPLEVEDDIISKINLTIKKREQGKQQHQTESKVQRNESWGKYLHLRILNNYIRS